ncbi:MAG: MtnX-like HAD-IB family phosphatase [Mycobacterium leprae]
MSHVGNFWSDAEKAPLVVLTDFDFTVTQVDVGDLITESLAPPSAATRARCAAGEAGSRVYWLDSMARVAQAEGEALADTAAIDPSFPSFAAWCQSLAIPLAVVSDGFWFYINRILGREGLTTLPVFCNEMPEPGRLQWPNANPACDHCGCCKAGVVRRVQATGARVIYCGDGSSDIFAAGYADWIFAKGTLATYLAAHDTPYFPLTSFAEVQQTLATNLAAFAAGTAPGRAQLGPHRRCRF